jgi:O-acetylhomoserine (thiol)-lyase
LFGGRYGALISFDLTEADDTFRVLDALRIVALSTHLSDNRTLAIPVATTIFLELGEPGRAEMGISPGLVRLSVGIEDVRDLIADFAQALGRSGRRLAHRGEGRARRRPREPQLQPPTGG